MSSRSQIRTDSVDAAEPQGPSAPRPKRSESNFPVQYIGANVPQAWAAGSVFMLTQALLGFLPDAPRSKLYVDPSLPAWLPDLMVRDLRIGKHKLDIRFWRGGEQTAFDVVKGEPRLVERCDIASKAAQLRTATDLAEASPETTNRPHKKGGARTAGRVCHPAPCRPRRPPSRRAGWRLAIAHLKE
jgi:hypothetical protein